MVKCALFCCGLGFPCEQAAVCQRNTSIQTASGEVRLSQYTQAQCRFFQYSHKDIQTIMTSNTPVFSAALLNYVVCSCCRYYSDIHSAASGCYQEMNSMLTELSGVSYNTYRTNLHSSF